MSTATSGTAVEPMNRRSEKIPHVAALMRATRSRFVTTVTDCRLAPCDRPNVVTSPDTGENHGTDMQEHLGRLRSRHFAGRLLGLELRGRHRRAARRLHARCAAPVQRGDPQYPAHRCLPPREQAEPEQALPVCAELADRGPVLSAPVMPVTARCRCP